MNPMMTSREEHEKETLLARVYQSIDEKFPKEKAALIKAMVATYYRSVAAEDLAARSTIDLYGSIVSHWHFLETLEKNEFKVRVYNPKFEQHGWQSTHTVVEIVQEDKPFMVDSVRMALNRLGLTVHLIMQSTGLKVERNNEGLIQHIYKNGETYKNSKPENIQRETFIYLEINKQSDAEKLAELEKTLNKTLKDVQLCVEDWKAMKASMQHVISMMKKEKVYQSLDETPEVLEFLEWIDDNHFTFLAYQERENETIDGKVYSKVVASSRLGVNRNKKISTDVCISELPERAQAMAFSSDPLLIGKSSTVSTVHRPVYCDFIAIKKFNAKGDVVGEYRFIGLYTAEAYHSNPEMIPLLSDKIEKVLQRAGLESKSHGGKNLLHILQTIPRDDLFYSDDDELYYLSTGIMHLQERQRIKLFSRLDPYHRYYSCLVYVPRDIFNSQLRYKFGLILKKAFGGKSISFDTQFSESVLARIHYMIRVSPESTTAVDVSEVENELVMAGRTWTDELHSSLIEHFGEEKGVVCFNEYQEAFSASYKDDFGTRTAAYDIAHMQSLSSTRNLEMSFYKPLEEDCLRFKLFQPKDPIPLSEIVPMLEFMGLRVLNERPYAVKPASGETIWINDFQMIHEGGGVLDVEKVKDTFQSAFYHIWHGHAENDGFNRLVLNAAMDWRDVVLLRAIGRYMWQIGFTFSQSYLENTLSRHSAIASRLVHLFHVRFNPSLELSIEERTAKALEIKKHIELDLEQVSNLDEDRIIRRYVDVLMACIRTNFFQKDEHKAHKTYMSFKLSPALISDIPHPVPMYEISVYSPRVEGVHLRMGKVARGGLRWSDRREDYRTEVLGLMKAQQVKNSVIVPMGAKGGFVPKNLPLGGSRDAIMQEGIACYKTFVTALLDVTDNFVEGKVIHPVDVVRYDEDDPYLVVAADKGTASFSDIANEISLSRHFWLQDAFASGGSAGYDHKKMGITARGGWESVKRHFAELNIDIQNENFTVIGIGDMSGDVFGNGLLLSEHIQMVGAFNHMHIFLDPDPDASKTFAERKRLFNLPRSTWEDFDPKLISKGGGVFLRSLKSIKLTPEVKKRFGLTVDAMEPNELIKVLLRAKVDLIWNGGIGTYVKATHQLNSEVGDRANDGLRVNGAELQARVVGEGGNLGFTQLGRVEYALKGGRINTDAIDNSGGVDCSDHEVNIKILLGDVMSHGDMTEQQRLALLVEMTDEVGELVLRNNKAQTEALSVAQANAAENLEMHHRMILELERSGRLDRALEFLPSKDDFDLRKKNKQGLTRPELAVLLAYGKNILSEELLNSDLPELPDVAHFAERIFPKVLIKRYKDSINRHRLKREIISTQLSNLTLNEMGINFVSRLSDETGASSPEIIKAYLVTREVFDIMGVRQLIMSSQGDSASQLKMLLDLNRLIRRAARWFLRHRRGGLNIAETIAQFKPSVSEVSSQLRHHLSGASLDVMNKVASDYKQAGVDESMAYRAAGFSGMFSALDIADAAITSGLPVERVMHVYFSIGATLRLGWVRELIKQHPVRTHWDSLARAAFRDDLDRQQRTLTEGILRMSNDNVQKSIESWLKREKVLVARWEQMANDLNTTSQREFTMYAVALRELVDLTYSCNGGVQ